jgi:hypothetical protein
MSEHPSHVASENQPDHPEPEWRQCNRCRRSLPITSFRKEPRCVGGRRHICYECEREGIIRARNASPKYKAAVRAKIRAWSQEFAQTDAGRACKRKQAHRYGQKYPEKAKAKRILRSAVESGKVVRPDRCQNCGAADVRLKDGRSGIQAHHHAGYDKPLEVVWLCYICHSKCHQGDSASHD